MFQNTVLMIFLGKKNHNHKKKKKKEGTLKEGFNFLKRIKSKINIFLRIAFRVILLLVKLKKITILEKQYKFSKNSNFKITYNRYYYSILIFNSLKQK